LRTGTGEYLNRRIHILLGILAKITIQLRIAILT